MLQFWGKCIKNTQKLRTKSPQNRRQSGKTELSFFSNTQIQALKPQKPQLVAPPDPGVRTFKKFELKIDHSQTFFLEKSLFWTILPTFFKKWRLFAASVEPVVTPNDVTSTGGHNKTHTFWFWVFRNFFCGKFMQNCSIMRQMNVQNESNVLSYWNPNLVRKSSRTVRFTPARYTVGASENRLQNGKNWGHIGVIFSILWTWKTYFFDLNIA